MPSALVLEFSVDGDPVPQGNHQIAPFGRRIVERASSSDGTGRLDVWRQSIVLATIRYRSLRGPLDEPVCVSATFRLRRPKRPSFRSAPATHPDLDKLARGLGDALVMGSVLRDDGRITRWVIEKVWTDGRPGVDVAVYRMEVGL